MQDPPAENIRGSMVSQRESKHIVRWDYLVIALVVGYVAWQVFGGISSSSSEEEEPSNLRDISDGPAVIDVA